MRVRMGARQGRAAKLATASLERLTESPPPPEEKIFFAESITITLSSEAVGYDWVVIYNPHLLWKPMRWSVRAERACR